jgi:threonine-phosphate decarboxylase
MSYDKFLELKSKSGLHSPSIFEMRSELNLDIKIDACFLCNPYAFDLFCEYYAKRDVMDYLKYYPPQNKSVADNLSQFIEMNPDYILMGNGAIQLIELILRELMGKKKCIITPTFSTYYEYDDSNIVYYRTYKENDFKVDVQDLISYCKNENVEALVIVNPNNPTGTSMPRESITTLAKSLPSTTIIIDESFIDFFDRKNSMEKDVYSNPNLLVIRSMSKDFGIAGLRLGYAIMNPRKREQIVQKYGLLWNINGLAHLFIEIMNSENFRERYEAARHQYLDGKREFFEDLKGLKKLKTYNSDANFFIVDCGKHINDVFSRLLFDYGIYTRILNDKLHLENTFLRIACGRREHNQIIFNALKEIEYTL